MDPSTKIYDRSPTIVYMFITVLLSLVTTDPADPAMRGGAYRGPKLWY